MSNAGEPEEMSARRPGKREESQDEEVEQERSEALLVREAQNEEVRNKQEEVQPKETRTTKKKLA